jgi:hypothetical protein
MRLTITLILILNLLIPISYAMEYNISPSAPPPSYTAPNSSVNYSTNTPPPNADSSIANVNPLRRFSPLFQQVLKRHSDSVGANNAVQQPQVNNIQSTVRNRINQFFNALPVFPTNMLMAIIMLGIGTYIYRSMDNIDKSCNCGCADCGKDWICTGTCMPKIKIDNHEIDIRFGIPCACWYWACKFMGRALGT